MVVGRSIGTGPATYLSKYRKVGVVVLISPFSSIRNIAKNIVGSFLGFLVKDRF